MIPAHAVPWPTRSTASGSSTTRRPSADLDPQAAAQPAADGRVIAFDARVDDRDGHAGAVGRPEHGSPIHDPERSVALEAGAGIGQERVAPGGESRIGHRAIGPDDVSGRLCRGGAGGR